MGVDNVLALRGDPIKSEQIFTPAQGGNAYALDLIKQMDEMNQGQYLHEETKNNPSNFCIGTAGYPEKHFEAMNMSTDLKYLKMKVDAGADFIVTQMFFDNSKYFSFVKKCREIGINIRIIPGIKPITTLKHISFLPKFFHIDFPEELSLELSKCKTNEQVKQVGKEWGISQAKELKNNHVPVIHFYTMGKGESVKNIAKAVF